MRLWIVEHVRTIRKLVFRKRRIFYYLKGEITLQIMQLKSIIGLYT